MNARTRGGDETGAIAILFALTFATMLVIGALAVDLGNAYQRKAEAQSQADLAALSAATALACPPAPATCGTVSTRHQAAVDKVRDYLKSNTKLGQSGGLAGLTSAMLTDGDLTNGEVTFPSDYSMKVVTPNAKVDFMLAQGANGQNAGPKVNSSVNVNASATVGLGTPGANAVLPFYAVSGAGCDYGSQALSDPANGKAKTASEMVGVTLAPPLTNPSQVSNKATLNSATPYQFDVGTPGTISNIDGNNLQSVDRLGFFRTPSDSPNAVETTALTNANNNSVSNIAIPATVYNAPGVWWIRVYSNTNGSANGWTPAANAVPIRIGDGPIQCGNFSSSGNFGSLKLARSTATSTWAPDNIAVGLQSPLTLQAMDPSNTSEIPKCTPGDTGVIYTATTGGSVTRNANTNCVDTDTGLTAEVTTQGLITGTATGNPGRLVRGTTTGVSGRQCAPGHASSTRSMLGYSLNDDVLSCFMADPSVALSAIATPSALPAALKHSLDPAIYDSPRFVYVPVISVTPSSGGSEHYAITDMRPGFITSEWNTSAYSSQTFIDPSTGTISGSTTNNGLTIPSNKVTTMQVFLFNKDALPITGGGAQPGVILDPNGPLAPFLIQ